MIIRSYRELSRIDDYYDRFDYLKIKGSIGEMTFGGQRYLNQVLYHSKRWKKARDSVIIRDNGCDLGHPDYKIYGAIVIHHMNPLTLEQVENDSEAIYDPDFLICVTPNTHNAIHYGARGLLPDPLIERRPWDTCPWKY